MGVSAYYESVVVTVCAWQCGCSTIRADTTAYMNMSVTVYTSVGVMVIIGVAL